MNTEITDLFAGPLPPNRTYPAAVARVIDGDTLVATIDLGMGLTAARHVRVYGINCPELHGPTAAAGLAAKAFVEALLPHGAPVALATRGPEETEKYGRVLADVGLADGRDLGTLLVASGNAVPYFGG